MKDVSCFSKVYVYRHPVDMRKQRRGLSLVAEHAMGLDPFSEALFVFVNRSGNQIRILYWDRTGFAMWSKQLEKSRFYWPRHLDGENIFISSSDLGLLLEGVDLSKLKKHKEVYYSSVS